jgi:hypothetical protein
MDHIPFLVTPLILYRQRQPGEDDQDTENSTYPPGFIKSVFSCREANHCQILVTAAMMEIGPSTADLHGTNGVTSGAGLQQI